MSLKYLMFKNQGCAGELPAIVNDMVEEKNQVFRYPAKPKFL